VSNANDERPDRRSLIVSAVATGGALPLLAGAAQADQPGKLRPTGTKIVVDLGNVTLSEAAALELQAQIRKAVLVAVATAGLKAPHLSQLPPGILGMVIEPKV
jgi:hypothetical protein